MIEVKTANATINTSFEMISKSELEAVQEQLRETKAKLDQSHATTKYFEAELERLKSVNDINKSLATNNQLLSDFEQQMTDEKAKTVELTSLVHSLQAQIDEVNKQYNGEIISKKSIQEEYNQLQGNFFLTHLVVIYALAQFDQFQKDSKQHLDRLQAEIENEQAKLAPVIDELNAVRKQRSEYADKYKHSCEQLENKDSKLHAAAEMFQSHRNQIDQLDCEKKTLQAQLESLKQSIENNKRSQEDFDAIKSALEEEINTHKAAIEALELEKSNLINRCNKLEQLEKDFEDMTQIIDDQSSKLQESEQLRSTIHSKDQRIFSLENEFKSVTRDCTELATSLKVLTSENEDLKKKAKEIHSDVVAKEDMIMEKTSKISQLQADLLAIQTRQQTTANDHNEIKHLRQALDQANLSKQSVIEKATNNEQLLVSEFFCCFSTYFSRLK